MYLLIIIFRKIFYKLCIGVLNYLYFVLCIVWFYSYLNFEIIVEKLKNMFWNIFDYYYVK